jgi:hypothetical protein
MEEQMVSHKKLFKIVLFVSVFIITSAGGGPLEDLQPGCWYEVPNSHLKDVAPDGWSANVIRPWCGGAYDTKRDRLVLFGGGHGDYTGNELYGFDVNLLKWIRLTNPSASPTNCEDPYADGRPNSRHTYGGVVYLPPPVDRFWTAAGSISRCGNCSGKTWMYNFDAIPAESGWSLQVSSLNGKGIGGCGVASAYDPVSGCIYHFGNLGYGSALLKFNPQNLSAPWSVLNSSISGASYIMGDVDPVRRKFVLVGGTAYGDTQPKTWVFDISNPNSVPNQVKLATTGAREIEGKNAPGVAYDPVSDKIVAWSGGANVYSLDLDTKVWKKHTPAATNNVIPTNVSASGGTFGRFRYVPSKNVFIAVNNINENVYFYRLTETPSAVTTDGSVAAGPFHMNIAPNPFNPNARITASVRSAINNLELNIYNISGKIVHSALTGAKELESGILWKANHMPPGIYLVQLKAGRNIITKRIVLSR